MCDYSLEQVKNRKAIAGEDLVLKRFNTGSKGFVSPADTDCAVCCEPGMTMTLHLESGPVDATFNRSGLYTYRDGVIIDGKFSLLQVFEEGTRATVIKPLPEAIVEAASAPVAFEPEIRVAELVPLAPALV